MPEKKASIEVQDLKIQSKRLTVQNKETRNKLDEHVLEVTKRGNLDLTNKGSVTGQIRRLENGYY